MVERYSMSVQGPFDRDPPILEPDNEGDWVRHSDYARLQEQVETLTKERDEAKAEVARYWTSADIKPWVELAEAKGLGHFGSKLKGMFSRAMKAEDDGRIEYARAEAAEAERDRLREALRDVRTAIMDADPSVLVDSLWMPDSLYKGGTVVDFIDAALQREPQP